MGKLQVLMKCEPLSEHVCLRLKWFSVIPAFCTSFLGRGSKSENFPKEKEMCLFDMAMELRSRHRELQVHGGWWQMFEHSCKSLTHDLWSELLAEGLQHMFSKNINLGKSICSQTNNEKRKRKIFSNKSESGNHSLSSVYSDQFLW